MESEQGSPAQPVAQTGRRRRWPWIVGGIVAFFVLALIFTVAIIAVLLSGGGGGSSASTNYFQEEYVSGEGSDRVAVIPVQGTIAADVGSVASALPTTTPRGLEDALDQAADDESVKGVVLEVNSPGGGVTPSAQMHKAILDFKREAEKPVVVSIADTAASGGYYIATAADDIVAQETTLTGSLGVYIGLLNFSEAADKYGVAQDYVKSGEFKTMGDPFKELTPGERDIFQSIVNENYDGFVGVIVEGRDMTEDEVREIADGRVYSGLQAEELGLVDQIGGLERAVELTNERADIEDPTVVRYVQEPGFGSLLLSRFMPEPPEAAKVMEAAGAQFNGTPQYLYVPGALGNSIRSVGATVESVGR